MMKHSKNITIEPVVTLLNRNDFSLSTKREKEKILQENFEWDFYFKFSYIKELVCFLSFSAKMLLAFPLGLLLRRSVRKNKRLNYILQFNELKQVRNNIEKGSFAYDTMLFNTSIFEIVKNKTHLANLVCLSLLFGDEFIDGLATTYTKNNIKKLLSNPGYNLYLQSKTESEAVTLFYEFDICDLIPNEVLQAVNPKYQINYLDFYKHLCFLLDEINLNLNKLPYTKRKEVAELICKVCNKCFDTYKADVQEFTLNYNFGQLLKYQQSKDDDIIKILLEIRGTLLNKNTNYYKAKYASWSYMVRSMQVYDDMQDIATDVNYQMNFLAYFAKTYFKLEWNWLIQNQYVLQNSSNVTLQQQVALNMPSSMIMCMQYNKNISFKHLNWVQQKIQNYLWRKNWLQLTSKAKYEKTKEKLNSILEIIKRNSTSTIGTELQMAHALDTALLFPELQNTLLTTLPYKQRYILKNMYTTIPTKVKAQMVHYILQKLK